MHTAGAGGDSHVVCLTDGTLKLKPSRVQPMAMTPGLPSPRDWFDGLHDSFLVLPVENLDPELVADDPILATLRQHGPLPPSRLAQLSGVSGIILEKRTERLEFLQRVVLAGFTPTDALHALGQLDIGESTSSHAGAEILAQALKMPMKEVCQRIVAETESAIETIILAYLGRNVWPGNQAVPLLSQRDNEYFTMHFALKLPLIGIGAAARCFLPGVAARLQTPVTFPEYCEVGNAIGAAMIGLDQLA